MDGQIYADLDEVRDNLDFLGEHQDRNFDVTGSGKNYLIPYFWEEFVRPINHAKGLFMYYRGLEKILKIVIEKSSISLNRLPLNAPEYLKEHTL